MGTAPPQLEPDKHNTNTPTNKVEVSLIEFEEPLLRAIDHFKKKEKAGIWEYLKDNLPIVTSLVAVGISILTLYYGYQFNKRDQELKLTQMRYERDKAASAELSEYLAKETDNFSRPIVANNLALRWGTDLLPGIYPALASPNSTIRAGAVLLTQQVYEHLYDEEQQATDQDKERAAARKMSLLATLATYYQKNKNLRRGVLEAFTTIATVSDIEQQRVLQLITESFDNDTSKCSTPGDTAILVAAFGILRAIKPSTAMQLVVKMTSTCNDEEARAQGINTTLAITRLPSISKANCDEAVAQLRSVQRSRDEAILVGDIETACTSKN